MMPSLSSDERLGSVNEGLKVLYVEVTTKRLSVIESSLLCTAWHAGQLCPSRVGGKQADCL